VAGSGLNRGRATNPAGRGRPNRLVRPAGWLCLLAGSILLFCAASARIGARVWQAQQRLRLEQRPVQPADFLPRHGEALGRLRVRRLGLDVMVAEGSDVATLRLGPGHMEGSALPGEGDNCIIAGHRDGPFRALRRIRRGDLIEMRTGRTVYHYEVRSVGVVGRDDTTPLARAAEPILTLVTCYPFDFVGPAPGRFIVRAVAREAEARPSSPPPCAEHACGA
jgi:LPXTG-site transpeptidase (sortase) family protein